MIGRRCHSGPQPPVVEQRAQRAELNGRRAPEALKPGKSAPQGPPARARPTGGVVSSAGPPSRGGAASRRPSSSRRAGRSSTTSSSG